MKGQGNMKDMVSIYVNMSTRQLKELRSKKFNRRQTLEHMPLGYFSIQEVRKLNQQILWIDAVLQSREDQIVLL